MSGELFVQTDSVRSYAQMHDQVASGLSQLLGPGAPEAAGVQTSHGTIAAAVSTALSGALGTRQGTVQTTATSGTTISELLQKAAQMYERGDRGGAEKLRAAAAVMGDAEAPPVGESKGTGKAPDIAQPAAPAQTRVDESAL